MTAATKTVDNEIRALVQAEIKREEDERYKRAEQQVRERQAVDTAERDRQTEIAQLRERIAVELDPAPIDAAGAELARAYDHFLSVCVPHDRRYSALFLEITNAAGRGPLPADMSATHRQISSGGVDWRKSRIHTRLIRAARAALDRNPPLDFVDLSRNPQD